MTGWTWDTVDALTLPQVDDLLGYWKQNRPLHLLVQDLHHNFLDVADAPPPDQEPPSLGELHSIAGMFT